MRQCDDHRKTCIARLFGMHGCTPEQMYPVVYHFLSLHIMRQKERAANAPVLCGLSFCLLPQKPAPFKLSRYVHVTQTQTHLLRRNLLFLPPRHQTRTRCLSPQYCYRQVETYQLWRIKTGQLREAIENLFTVSDPPTITSQV